MLEPPPPPPSGPWSDSSSPSSKPCFHHHLLHVQEELPLQDLGTSVPPSGAQPLCLQPHQKQYGPWAASQSGSQRHPEPSTPNPQVAGGNMAANQLRAELNKPTFLFFTLMMILKKFNTSVSLIWDKRRFPINTSTRSLGSFHTLSCCVLTWTHSDMLHTCYQEAAGEDPEHVQRH